MCAVKGVVQCQSSVLGGTAYCTGYNKVDTLNSMPVPFSKKTVRLELGACKRFCDISDCTRRIFTERLPGFVAPWARRTRRLGEQLTAIALGGFAGTRLR